jgi:hypothetical protein
LSIASFAIRRAFGYVAVNPEMRIPSRMKSPTLAALTDEKTASEYRGTRKKYLAAKLANSVASRPGPNPPHQALVAIAA